MKLLLLPILFCFIQAVYSVTNYSSGVYTISYDEAQLPMLRIYDKTGRIIWFSSATNRTLVAAARVQENVTQIGGDFVFNNKIEQVCTDTNITRVDSLLPPGESSQVFLVAGTLCSGTVSFQLTFQGAIVYGPVARSSSSHDDPVMVFHHLRFNLTLLDPGARKFNQLRLVYGCERDEQLYGFGAQYSKFNVKGTRLPVFLSEQGVGRGKQPLTFLLDLASPGAGGTWYTTYTSVPHYITSRSRSLMLESMERAVFDTTDPTTISIELDSNVMLGRIINGDSPQYLISSFTALIGRMKPLPQWVGNGAVLGLQGGTEAVKKTLQQVEEEWSGNHSDVAAVWLQDWTGQRQLGGKNDLSRVGLWWNWEVDSAHYPNWTDLISELASKNIKTLTYINPLFGNVSLRGTPYRHNYYEEGLENGYFVRQSTDGSVWSGYSNSTLADLTNPLAYKWMVDMIVQNMLSTGVCGWMHDFGESIPLNAALKSGADSRSFHTLYASVWAQLSQDAIKKANQLHSLKSYCGSEDVVFFMRSGNIYSPGISRSFWLGDQLVTWDADDGLATVVIGMLSEGISGFSHTHSDIGGYTAIDYYHILKYVRQKELFMRWCELAAFTTMYRSHLGTLPSENWQFNSDNETLQHFFRMAVVFKGLSAYRSVLMEETYRYGWPVTRHMMLNYPNNSKVYMYAEDLTRQFMLGDQFIVAPVLEKGATSVRVFLPMGTTWHHIWTGHDLKGDDAFVTVSAPIGQPCLLYSQGSQYGEQLVTYLKQRKIL